MKIFTNLEKILQFSLLFLIPTQLSIHFWPSFALIFGLRIDYLAPTIYLTDVSIMLVFVFWVFNDFSYIKDFLYKNRNLFFFISILIVLNICFSTNWLISFLKYLKILEVLTLTLYIKRRFGLLGYNNVNKIIFASTVVVSIVGIIQFLTGGTVGGLVYYLGERSFDLSTPGISLVQIRGVDYLRAYSFFPHPNALSGYLSLVMFYLMSVGFFNKNKKTFYFLILPIVCIFLAFSLSSYLAITIYLIILMLKNNKMFANALAGTFVYLIIISSLLTPVFANKIIAKVVVLPSNISERLYLSLSAVKMLSQNYFTGVGLNNFIPNIQYSIYGQQNPILLQPVHNIFLLVLSETGIVGFVVFVSMLILIVNKSKLNKNSNWLLLILYICITGFFDHYWITIQQNLLILAFVFGSSKQIKS